MKIKEVRELETKDLAERIEAEVAKYNQMKLNHAITPLENPSQIKAARVAINRYMNREGQVWIRIFPDKPITRKPADVRMGKGKGDPAGWVAPVTPGRILFEVEGVPFDVAKEALRLGAQKLPVKTKFVVRRDYDKNA